MPSTRLRSKARHLRSELDRLQGKLSELEATTFAIRNGEVDAIVVDGPGGSRIFQLQNLDDPARLLAERINEGAATLAPDGTILSCNRRLAEMAGRPAEQILGSSLYPLFGEEATKRLTTVLDRARRFDVRVEFDLCGQAGARTPVQLAFGRVDHEGSEPVLWLVMTDLSELKRARQELREQAKVFELAHDAIVMRDLNGRVLSWNRGAVDLYGWSAQQALGKRGGNLLKTEYPVAQEEILKTVFSSREWAGELKQTARDGRALVVASRWSLIRDKQGNASAMLEVNRDVTAAKQAEAALKEREADFRTLAALVPQLIWICTPDGKNTFLNQRWLEYTGLTLEQGAGEGWWTPCHAEDRDRSLRVWQHAMKTGNTYRIECRLRAANGGYRWFLVRGEPMLDEAGGILKWFGTCTDVDDLKRSEALLEERVAARTLELRESEQQVQKKLNSILSPEGDLEHFKLADLLDVPAVQSLVDDIYKLVQIPMRILDPEGNVLVDAGWQDICSHFHRVHPEACRQCTESDQELSSQVAPGDFKMQKCRNSLWQMGTPLTLGDRHIGDSFCCQFLFEDEAVDTEAFRRQAARYGFEEEAYIAALARVPRFSREKIETGMALYSKLAELLSRLGYGGIKLGRAMAATTRVNSELLSSSKELEAFAYSVSHDLRAPLRHLDGFLSLLFKRSYANLDAEAKHYIDCTLQASQRMGRLIDDLLQFSRLGRSEMRKSPVRLSAMVDATRRELAPEIGERAIEWQVSALPTVQADQGMLQQVVANLLGNALKFTRHRNPATIAVGSTPGPDGEVVTYVRDNGAGFDMRYYNKLFEVFQRLHSEDEFEGTGIGLANVRRIVERHGGRVWAESAVDAGATFYFSLPGEPGTGREKPWRS